MDLIYGDRKIILYSLDLWRNSDTTSRWSVSTENGVTHGQVLSKALKLAAYPIVRDLLSPTLLEFCERLLKNMVRTYLFWFWVLDPTETLDNPEG